MSTLNIVLRSMILTVAHMKAGSFGLEARGAQASKTNYASCSNGCFCKLGLAFLGVLITRALQNLRSILAPLAFRTSTLVVAWGGGFPAPEFGRPYYKTPVLLLIPAITQL